MQYLALFGDSASKYRLTIIRELAEAVPAAGVPLRLSPIFQVLPVAHPSFGDVNGFIGFFCPLDAFALISRQTAKTKQQLWFNHGLASVIYFAETLVELTAFAEGELSGLSAYEIWNVNSASGAINIEARYVRSVEASKCTLATFTGLSKDNRRLLEEIQLNLFELGRCASIYMPEQVVRFERVVVAVDEIAKEIFEIELSLREGKTNGDATIHQRLNQALSYLIQLNSALAYIVSQATFGAVPILESPCLISNHSLLGIGNSYRALSATATYVEDVFERNSVLTVLSEKYSKTAPFDIFMDLPRYDPQKWRGAKVELDQFLPTEIESVCSKISYFSSRLGFSESHFSVTAASQVLHAADSPRWSLMTLTHELLHSHVSGLLAGIFSERLNSGLTLDSFNSLYGDFKRHVKNPAVAAPSSTLGALRYAIINFSIWKHEAEVVLRRLENVGSDAGSVEYIAKAPESGDLFRQFFNQSLRLLEEIVVHTLDLRYFYCGDRSLFIKLLWQSWTTVPAVVGDLETYLLRSLVSSASIEAGSVNDRFERSVGLLRGILSGLSKDVGNVFLLKTIQFLDSPTNVSRLRIVFGPAIYVADLTRIFLSANTIESSFWSGDENIEPGDSAIPAYRIETGKFEGAEIKNPVALLASRLREVNAIDDEDRRSAWLLMAISSSA